MLEQKIVELANRMVEVEFEKQQDQLKTEIQKLDDEFRLAGQWSSPQLILAVRKLCNQEVRARTQAVWQCLLKVLSAQNVGPAEGIGDALKEEVLRHRDSIISGPSEELRKIANRIAPTVYSTDLAESWEHAKKEVLADMDLFILSNQVQSEKKEEQTNSNDAISRIDALRKNPDSSNHSDAPKAFLSYSTADQEMAAKLANDLRAQGVDAWYAEWEIKPGDSLRRKIERGIEDASYFMVLLTPNSLKSEWVQTELDAGIVRRIEGSCRLVPIVQGLNDDQIPTTLRGLKWVKVEPYDSALRELVNVCHGIENKPELGPRPVELHALLSTNLGLSVHAQRLAVLLAERSETGNILDPMIEASKVIEELKLTENEAAAAADELEERSWVKLHKHVGMGNVGFGRISPRPLLFFNVDPHMKGWTPKEDARGLAAAMVNCGSELVSLTDADRILGWGARRLNPAALYLHAQGLASSGPAIGCAPYAFQFLQVTARTRRFAVA